MKQQRRLAWELTDVQLEFRLNDYLFSDLTHYFVNIKVIGRHYQEEMVLHVMELIEILVKWK